jgi:hypothetical protein
VKIDTIFYYAAFKICALELWKFITKLYLLKFLHWKIIKPNNVKGTLEKNQYMFQICVPNQKVQKTKISLQILELFFNAMIRNIKIEKIFNIINVSKCI